MDAPKNKDELTEHKKRMLAYIIKKRSQLARKKRRNV